MSLTTEPTRVSRLESKDANTQIFRVVKNGRIWTCTRTTDPDTGKAHQEIRAKSNPNLVLSKKAPTAVHITKMIDRLINN